MKRSTKHLLLQRLIALLGFGLFFIPLAFPNIENYPKLLSIAGISIFIAGLLSGFEIGPWGKYTKKLIIEEDELKRASFRTSQPWEN